MNDKYDLISVLFWLFVVLVLFSIVIINNYRCYRLLTPRKARKKKLNIRFKKPIKLRIFHTIITDKAKYIIYNIKQDKHYHDSLYIERNDKSILENEISDQAFELWVSPYETFVRGCIFEVRFYIKKQKEIIIEDFMNND